MTRPQASGDPEELRNTADLRGVFLDHEGPTVDVPGLLSGVRERIARRRKRRRTAGILAAGLATALVAAVPIVASSIPDEDPSRTAESGAASPPSGPTVLSDPGDDGGVFDPAATFSVGDLPPGYTLDLSSSEPGAQDRSYYSLGEPNTNLEIRYFDPTLSRRATPVVEPDAVTIGNLEVFPMALDPGRGYGLAWQPQPDRWVTVTSTASDDVARQEVTDTVPLIDLGSQQRLTFPIQVTDVPEGFALRSSSRRIRAEPRPGDLQATLVLDDVPGVQGSNAGLSIYVENNPQQATEGPNIPNTSVSGHPSLYLVDTAGRQRLTVYQVDGISYTIGVASEYADRFAEDDVRRFAAGIVVLPGAAMDPSVWTTQPLP